MADKNNVLTIDKITAAEAQIKTAIRLFFENRDLVSFHTLVCAASDILYDYIDHFSEKGAIFELPLLFHHDTLYIKDEYRKEWNQKLRMAQNFFKHADNHLKKNIRDIEFNPDLTQLRLFEAIQCYLHATSNQKLLKIPELRYFFLWFLVHNTRIFKCSLSEISEILKIPVHVVQVVDKQIYLEGIKQASEN